MTSWHQRTQQDFTWCHFIWSTCCNSNAILSIAVWPNCLSLAVPIMRGIKCHKSGPCWEITQSQGLYFWPSFVEGLVQQPVYQNGTRQKRPVDKMSWHQIIILEQHKVRGQLVKMQFAEFDELSWFDKLSFDRMAFSRHDYLSTPFRQFRIFDQ